MKGSRSARIMLVEQYFCPEAWGGAEIPRDIAIALTQAGIGVEALCGTERYAPGSAVGKGSDAQASGVEILRIPRILPGPARRLKGLRIVWFCLAAMPVLLCRGSLALIATQTAPPLIVPTVAIVAALRRIPFVIIAQDIYPEVLFASGVMRARSFLGRSLSWLFAWAYRRAAQVVALGPFMEQRIRAKGVATQRIITISNWATGDLRRHQAADNPLRSRWSLEDRFVVLYSGNMGIGHEFETFLEGARLALGQGVHLAVLFVGGGSRLTELRLRCQTLGLSQCTSFHDYVPAEELPWIMGVADLALVTLRAGFEGLIVPSKLFGYMGRGVPTLYIGPDSDVARIIRESGCGACCDPGAPQAVARILWRAANEPGLLREWGDKGRACYETRFNRVLALQRYVGLVQGLLARNPEPA